MTLEYWTLYQANDPEKKWAVRVPTASGRGKVVEFGGRRPVYDEHGDLTGYEDYEDFTTHKDVARRKRYRDRHAHDRLDDPYAPGFWSMWALWGKSDDLDTAFADAVKRAKKVLKQAGVAMPRRRNPVRTPFDFMRYEEYARGLSDEALSWSIKDAGEALEIARGWRGHVDEGEGEAKYSDQLSVLRREQRSRGLRHNPDLVDETVDAFLETADFVDSTPAPRFNGVNDPAALKAVFMGGGPGSGKSYTVDQIFGLPKGLPLVLGTTTGLKIVNSDPYFEHFLWEIGVDPKTLGTMSEQRFKELTEAPGSPRHKAKVVRDKFLRMWLDQRLGLIIDGTGDEFQKIAQQRERLSLLGYDCCMIFVNTSLEVAQQRNQMRDRTLDPKLVSEIWHACQANLPRFAELFGDSFVVINADRPGSVTSRIRRRLMNFINAPVENYIGQEWLAEQMR